MEMEPSENLAKGNLSDLEMTSSRHSSSSFLSMSMKPCTLPSPSLYNPPLRPRPWKLRFVNSPPPRIFTSSRIEAEDGSPIAIELVYAATDARVTSDLRLEIVALDADITEENLTTEEFNRNIQPLLVGDLTVTLKDGVGVIGGDVAFTGNSTLSKHGKFRLGVKAIDGGVFVVEAISKAFACIDHPGLGQPFQQQKSVSESCITGNDPPSDQQNQKRLHQIYGTRPSTLVVRKDSHKIKRPTKHVIHTSALDFRSLVQRLSGISSEVSLEPDNGKGVSPAARLAATENACQKTGKEPAARHESLQLEEAAEFGNHAMLPTLTLEMSSEIDTFPPAGSMNPFEMYSLGYASASDLFSYAFDFDPLDTTVASSSKNMQDTELSIGFPGSFVDEGPQFTDLSGCDNSGILSRRVGSSDSKDYDVVIRYKREDISYDNFISHLRAALCRRGISVHGESESDEVDECRILIIVLPRTHIPSSFLKILEHKGKEPRVVYPIFYGISPSDLISNNQNYERFFLQDERKRWQAAWKEITQTPGYILTDKSESELIDEIVRDALKVLRSNDNEKMVGMDMQIEEILSLLCIESPDIRSVGIWGTVGIGKTAIAEEIVRRISVQYETCVFVKDFHKEVEVKGHDAVREGFLSKLLEVSPHVVQISDIKTSFLKSRLQRKRVLVILDDVNDFRDVETFLGKFSYFGPGSRIIITSRNKHVFVRCKIEHVYEVKPLDTSKSLLLLARGIFPCALPHEVYKTRLSLELVKFSNGNPQVLQFCSKSNAAWGHEHAVKVFLISKAWKQLAQQILETSSIYIPGIFERSCIGLDDNERSIFLDIAYFFRKMDIDNLAMLLDGCGFSAHVGFRSLVDKSLLTISHNMVDMLSFLQVTGREIVRQESPDRPGNRSRLWNSNDIMDVFKDYTGTSAIEGIFLDLSKLKSDANPKVFENMCNLRLLKLYFSEVIENHGVSLPQGLEYLPSKLRLLHWEYYPLSSLPRSFDPKNLVELNLPNSCAKKLWKGKKSLEKLKKMRLSYSYQLTKIPRLSSAPNLEHIDLEGCNSLVSISQSISSLKKLVFLNLKDCTNLESIPCMIDLESLEILNLSGCSKLENFPEISPNVKELYIGGTMIQEIPPSVKNLVLLEKLDMENSRRLVNLPMNICKLKHLETLNLSGCTSLERFPDLSRKMKCLRLLDLSRTAIKEIPSSISNLTALEELRFVNCINLVRLPENVWSLRFKVEFRQIDTQKFSKLWNRFGWLKKVQIS